MFHLTNILLTIGAFAFIFGVATVARAYREKRREEAAPFRDYFGPEYDRDLFRQSSWCDHENPYDRQTLLDAFNLRDRGATTWYSRGRGTTLRNRDRD
jgi:hypothetical protein